MFISGSSITCVQCSVGVLQEPVWPEQILCQPIAVKQSSYSLKPNMHSRPMLNLIKKEMEKLPFLFFAFSKSAAFGYAAQKEKHNLYQYGYQYNQYKH